ncbi:MAG: DUF480 domain-containing protein [Planctomycetales bacterium]|nr:DUF480 domain-containing protein [Planctomycetales bacterium]
MNTEAANNTPCWQPLSAIDRRVAGVMVEKAKTTPSAYPLTVNAIRVASNQKSNRSPQMELDEYDVEESLTRLRKMGVVTEIVGDGRTSKFRHMMYEWLGVDKVELAVMTELLLRGTQTVGELRGRAARMDPIADLSELTPILESLKEKRLIIFLSPMGRGAVVTHALYQEKELERIRREYGVEAAGQASSTPAARPASAPEPVVSRPAAVSTPPAPAASPTNRDAEVLQQQVQQLQAELTAMREALEAVTSKLREDLDEIRRELGM